MTYTKRQQEYIDSVGGEAHNSAVRIIGELEADRPTWIPTSKRLPTNEDGDEEDGVVRYPGDIAISSWAYVEDFGPDAHWQRLPAMPKEEVKS